MTKTVNLGIGGASGSTTVVNIGSAMHSIDDIRAALKRDGFALADDLLPRPIFEDLDARVLASWRGGIGWNTRVKGPGTSRNLSLATGDRLHQIAALVDRVDEGSGDVFTYLYHQLHADRDESGLVRSIEEVALAAWREAIKHLIGPFERTNFSLTAFTPGCRLARHTAHGGESAYRLTILLYFTGEGSSEGSLMFGGSEAPACIAPRPNRSVIFVPSATTTHWINRVPFGKAKSARIAFSGWLI
ncbi:2OG-Fe(II) oxygenase [Cereibacter johrii]|uniref:2OG-Fe(II) oxygenase n=1 Tax=Cereibacter johrii TaxID=445629 RepID=UPI002287148E|nr:2OG-Fe(II) oxygenase [Cereibacter johrii]